MYTRRQLRREAALCEAELEEIRQCRRPHYRLGFAYQLSFVRLLNCFANQQPFEVVEVFAIFTSVQLGVDCSLPGFYEKRQQRSISNASLPPWACALSARRGWPASYSTRRAGSSSPQT